MHTRFIWPFMRRDVKTWCEQCIPCQQQKVTRHIKPPIQRFPTGNRFETLHLDIVGPLPMSAGKTYILTMMDRKTRWPEAVPISSITADNVAKHLVDTWFSRFGIPDNIITDQGTQFEGALFTALSKTFGFKHIHTTSYHPQSNGMIERFHRSLKTSLRCLSISANWTSSLPLVLLGWRNTMHSASGTSPSQLLFGIGTAFPDEFFTSNTDISFKALDAARRDFLESDTNPSFGASSSYKSYVPTSLNNCKFVWLRSRDTFHMKPRYLGPFKVLEFKDNNTVVILRNDNPFTINIDKVKPAFGFCEESQQSNHRHELPRPDTFLPSLTNNCPAKLPHPSTLDPTLLVSNGDIETPNSNTDKVTLIPEHKSILAPYLHEFSDQNCLTSQSRKHQKSVTFAQWSNIHDPNYSSDSPRRLTRTKL